MSEPTSVALVSQWFAPEPITVPVWIAHALRRVRWDVRVVTGIPNFPTGRVADGYSAWRPRQETMEGFPVHRTPLYPHHGSSAAKRVANYLSWAATASVAAPRSIRDADVTLVYSSPATAAAPAMAARWRYGTPYVLMVQDVWPDSIFASGFLQHGAVRRGAESAVGRFAQAAYAGAHSIAVISPGMKDLLISRGVPGSKIQVVYNWVDEAVFKPAEPDPAFRTSLGIGAADFLLMYAGNHGAAQDLTAVIDAFGHMRDTAPNIHLVMIGEGIAKVDLVRRASQFRLDRVHFLDPLPIADMTPVIAAADAHLVTLADQPLFHITMPSKVQSLLAAGKPILVSAPGDAARVVVESGAGLASPPGDAKRLAAAIRELASVAPYVLARMSAAGRSTCQTEMSEQVGVGLLSAMLSDARDSRGSMRCVGP